MTERLLWLDVETTGLDHDNDHLLEIAAVVTTFDASFTIVAEFSKVLQLPLIYLSSVDPHVLKMHVESGLWDDCRKSRMTAAQATHEMLGWFYRDARVDGESNIYAAGRSVHFDIDWIRRDQQLWNGMRLHHRRFDLTPIKAFAALSGIPFEPVEDHHRAMADVLSDIELARELAETVRLEFVT